MNEEYDAFLDLSAAITGFTRIDLLGTGVAGEFLNTLKTEAGEPMTNALVSAWNEAVASGKPLKQAVQQAIFDNADLQATARNLIKLWYTGQWGDDVTVTVSSEAYKEGLVWKAIHAHPQGAKQQGFGTWSFPPDSLEDAS